MARASELAGEGLVRQGFLQRLQRGEFPLVEGGEALGFGQTTAPLIYLNGVATSGPWKGDATPLGLRKMLGRVTQGRSFLATLG